MVSGTIKGAVSLGAGNDTFLELGSGNDTYFAIGAGGGDEIALVKGGAEIDLYDASAAAPHLGR
jgi:hypothetical protein